MQTDDAAALAALPCRFRGPPTGDVLRAVLRRERLSLPVWTCQKHGRCTLTRRAAPTQACAHCHDREEDVQPSPPVLWPGLADPLAEAPPPNPNVAWGAKPSVRARHVGAWRALLSAELPPCPPAGGDGIAYVGGGAYWPMLLTGLRMARRQTDLPIRVYHRGEAEPVRPLDLAGLGDVQLVDVTRFTPYRRLGGWEAKLFAVLDAPWERVLLLDADAYLVAPPAPLLALATPQEPFVFWADFPHHDQGVHWEWWGASTSTRFPSVQGGHIVFRRPACWRQLLLSHWLNQHSDYSYHAGYGDQDQWRVAWQQTGAGYRYLGRADWHEHAFVCRLDGKPVVVHRCRAKWWGKPDDVRHDALPLEAVAWSDRCKSLDVPNALPPSKNTSSLSEAADVFGRIYATGAWGQVGSSGAGSSPAEAKPYLAVVEVLAAIGGWGSAVDLGSGTGEVSEALPIAHVVQVDAYDALGSIEPRGVYRQSFYRLCIDRERALLPIGHVALLKDVIHHWPNALVVEWLRWAKTCGKWRGVLVTFDVANARAGADCPLGGYRPLSPALPPLDGLGLFEVCRYLHKVVCWLPC